MAQGMRKPEELVHLPTPGKKYFGERGRDLRKAQVEKMPRRTWQVNEVQDKHQEIIRRIVLGQGNKFISEQLDVTPQMVSMVRNSPVVKERIAVMHAARDKKTLDVAAQIRAVAPKSIQLLEQIITGEGEGEGASLALRAKVAESNLDRAGYGAIKKVQGAVAHFTADDIRELKKEALQRISPVEASV